jgi:hypothetical protein
MRVKHWLTLGLLVLFSATPASTQGAERRHQRWS